MSEDKMYYLTNDRGYIIHNILEVSEGWCWAMFYHIQDRKRRKALPSETPPDWIASLKQIGYKCHELKHSLVNENTKTNQIKEEL